MALDFRFEKRGSVRFSSASSEGSSNCSGHGGRLQNLSDRWNHIGVASAGVEKRPTLSPINSNHLSNSPHMETTLGILRVNSQGSRVTQTYGSSPVILQVRRARSEEHTSELQ